MAIQNINIGYAANDGTGDDLRDAFIKINQNFQELDSIAFQTGNNLGSGGYNIYANTSGNSLNFKTLVAGNNIALSATDTTVTINSTVSTLSIITTDTGSIHVSGGVNYNINGGQGIVVTADENTKKITIAGGLSNDSNPVLSADLNAANHTINNVGNIVLSQIGGIDYASRLGRFIEGLDLGNIVINVQSALEYVIYKVGIDQGTITNPDTIIIDLGSIV